MLMNTLARLNGPPSMDTVTMMNGKKVRGLGACGIVHLQLSPRAPAVESLISLPSLSCASKVAILAIMFTNGILFDLRLISSVFIRSVYTTVDLSKRSKSSIFLLGLFLTYRMAILQVYWLLISAHVFNLCKL